LDATSNNGKNMTKPIVAPDGYYTFYFDEDYAMSGCGIPSGLFTSNITYNSARLNWMPVPEAESYTIVGGKVGAGTTTLQVAAPADFRNVNNILQPGATYRWQIRANCADGSSDFSEFVFFTMNCGAPENLNTINITSNSATLTWEEVPGAFGYQIKGGLVGSGFSTFQTGPGQTSLTANGSLQAGVQYQWKVRAFCNSSLSEASAWSETVVFTTAAGIEELNTNPIEARVIPNPNSGDFIVRVSDVGPDARMRLLDLAGRTLNENRVGLTSEGDRDITFSGIATGVYLLEIQDGDRRSVLKVFVR